MTTIDVEAPAMRDVATTVPRARPKPSLGPHFWRLWSASTISNLGDGLALVAFPLMATQLTDAALLVAGVTIAQRIPWLFFALPAGALADRLNRAGAMASVDLGRALILLGLACAAGAGALSIPLLYIAAFALGTLETMFAACAHAAIPALVGRERLDQANGYMSATETGGAELVGPALGGVLFAAAVAVPVAADAVTFAASAALLVKLRQRLPAPRREQETQLREEITAGLQFFRGHPLLRLLAGIVGGLAFLQAMVMAVIVLFAIEELQLSSSGYGLFVATGSVGGIAGALLAERFHRSLGTARTVTASAALAAAGYLLIALTNRPAVAAVGWVIETFAVSCGNVATISTRHRLVPDELQGRVGNIFRMSIWGVIPLGLLSGGILATAGGNRLPIVVAGVAQLVLAALTCRVLRRRLESDRTGDVIDLRAEEPAFA